MKILKTMILISIICFQSIVVANDNQNEPASHKENIGFGLGTLVGGVLAGPIGVIVGAGGGTWLGARESETDETKYVLVEDLKIYIRDLNKEDISKRGLPKNTTGVVVTKIEDQSPLMFVSTNDVIVELQKKKVLNVNQFKNLIQQIIDENNETLYLAIYNSNNQRTYITVKLN